MSNRNTKYLHEELVLAILQAHALPDQTGVEEFIACNRAWSNAWFIERAGEWLKDRSQTLADAKGMAEFTLEHCVFCKEGQEVDALATVVSELTEITADVGRGKYSLDLEGCQTIRHARHREKTHSDNLRSALFERLRKLRWALSALKQAAPKSEWVRVQDKAPDEDETVLVAVLNEAEDHGTGEFVRFPDTARGTIYACGDTFHADTDEGEYEGEEILGWQPLPLPPNQKKEQG